MAGRRWRAATAVDPSLSEGESLSLRHVRAHCAPAVKTSLRTGFYFVRSMALPFSRRTRSAGLRREMRLENYLYSPVIGFEKAAAIHPYFFPVIICCRISRKTAAEQKGGKMRGLYKKISTLLCAGILAFSLCAGAFAREYQGIDVSVWQ